MQTYNPNISCNVKDCRYNSRKEDCCTLAQIDVQQKDKDVMSEHNTCCHSFELKG